jgi:hypothetical protein
LTFWFIFFIFSWIEEKKVIDNAEGLWRVHDKIYDLNDFISKHPGGSEWLEMTKGIDITEQFETHHITSEAEQVLKKYFVREAAEPRNYKFTYNEKGFYRTLKRRVAEKLDGLDRTPLKISNLISDLMLGLVFTSAVLAATLESKSLAFVSGIFVFWQFVIAHNYFHQKDNWRMFCFNLSLLNHREWRVSHAMSHHLYPNSYYDLEITMFEPFLCWLPYPKTRTKKIVMMATTVSTYVLLTTFSFLQR